MAQQHSDSAQDKMIYRKASRRLAFQYAMPKASGASIFVALGVFFSETPSPLLWWGLTFFGALAGFYLRSLRDIERANQNLHEFKENK